MRLYTIRSGAPAALGSLGADLRASGMTTYYSADPPAAGVLDRTMTVRFSAFGTWYEVSSYWEGNFIERVMRGAFAKTMTERGSQVKCLLSHGMEFDIGDKPLGVPIMLAEEPRFARMDVALLDTSYNRDQVIPGVDAGAYGSSFMFQVLSEAWDMEPDASDHNPKGLPERTITENRLFEDGPVTWPANPDATAEMNSSGVDQYMSALRTRDRARYDALERQYAGFRAQNRTDTGERPAVIDLSPGPVAPAPEGRHVPGITADARRRALDLLKIGR